MQIGDVLWDVTSSVVLAGKNEGNAKKCMNGRGRGFFIAGKGRIIKKKSVSLIQEK